MMNAAGRGRGWCASIQRLDRGDRCSVGDAASVSFKAGVADLLNAGDRLGDVRAVAAPQRRSYRRIAGVAGLRRGSRTLPPPDHSLPRAGCTPVKPAPSTDTIAIANMLACGHVDCYVLLADCHSRLICPASRLLRGNKMSTADDVRRKLNAGALPMTKPEQLWRGYGVGDPCSVCGRPVLTEHVQYQFDISDGGRFRFHIRCLGMWEAELYRRGWLKPPT
jgi:hypothetical protein